MEDSKEVIEVIEAEEVKGKKEVMRNRPTKHNKFSMTEKQTVFAKELARTGDATNAVITAYGDEVRYPSQFGYSLRNKPAIQKYLMDTAQECVEIQMEMILDKKTPAAVRMDGIKDRLNRIGIKDTDDDENDKRFSIGDITINVLPR